MLISWYRAKATTAAMFGGASKDRINHKRIDELIENPLVADPDATYAKEYYLNLSTLAPIVSGERPQSSYPPFGAYILPPACFYYLKEYCSLTLIFG